MAWSMSFGRLMRAREGRVAAQLFDVPCLLNPSPFRPARTGDIDDRCSETSVTHSMGYFKPEFQFCSAVAAGPVGLWASPAIAPPRASAVVAMSTNPQAEGAGFRRSIVPICCVQK
jgi:hypothetical protein